MDALGKLVPYFFLIWVQTTLGCNINNCVQSAFTFTLQSCKDYTNQLDCIKKEYDMCKSDGDRHALMMSAFVSMGLNRGQMCGFDINQVQSMLTARAGLMTSMMNNTGMFPMMMGDDGPLGDDGPFDDGPFDDGPFDDGPFDSMDDDTFGMWGMPGVFPGPGATTGDKTAKPPPAPQLLPTFRGGAAMQYDETDKNTGVPRGVPGCLLLGCIFLVSWFQAWAT